MQARNRGERGENIGVAGMSLTSKVSLRNIFQTTTLISIASISLYFTSVKLKSKATQNNAMMIDKATRSCHIR